MMVGTGLEFLSFGAWEAVGRNAARCRRSEIYVATGWLATKSSFVQVAACRAGIVLASCGWRGRLLSKQHDSDCPGGM